MYIKRLFDVERARNVEPKVDDAAKKAGNEFTAIEVAIELIELTKNAPSELAAAGGEARSFKAKSVKI